MTRLRPIALPRAALCAALLLAAPAESVVAQHDPLAGQWGKDAPEDVRVMTWNVRDTLCSSNAKLEGQNNWSACARIVAALRPDVLLLQECGDNTGNGTGSGVDSIVNLSTTLNLFLHGGTDPFNGGAVTAYVQKYAPGYELPFRFIGSETDGFNRNCVLSRFPFQDQNGDGTSQYADIPNVSAHLYAPGGDGGLRGFQFVEVDLDDGIYVGDLVVGNAHLKAGGSSSDQAQRETAARNVAYVVDHWFNGAGTGAPDPFGRIADSPQATQILGSDSAVILGGDWNEEEDGGARGPAAWLSQAQQPGGMDGTDRDRSDMSLDDARNPFNNDGDTIGNKKFDYLAWQDAQIGLRLSFLFDAGGVPVLLLPDELAGMPNPGAANVVASDHLPVIADFQPALSCELGPAPYCVGAPNSGGGGAVMAWAGSTSVSANDLSLLVSSAAPNQPGIFFYGPATVQAAFGDGFLCVDSGGIGVFRLGPPVVPDGFGDGAYSLDLTQAPAGAGPGQIEAGSTWYFQFWYRDPGGPGGSGFNLSNGLEVPFCD